MCCLSTTTVTVPCLCRSMQLQARAWILDSRCKAQQGSKVMSAQCLVLVLPWGAVMLLKVCKCMRNLGTCLHLNW